MDTMLVTGGAGFIGSNFVRLALRRGAGRVVVFDKLTYAGSLLNLKEVEADPRFAFIRGDIGDRTAVRDALQRYRPLSIVHFAAETHVDRSIEGPRNFLDANVIGTFELLEAVLGLLSDAGCAARAFSLPPYLDRRSVRQPRRARIVQRR
jgi:dTDP-glucose 4,6-dehydratase